MPAGVVVVVAAANDEAWQRVVGALQAAAFAKPWRKNLSPWDDSWLLPKERQMQRAEAVEREGLPWVSGREHSWRRNPCPWDAKERPKMLLAGLDQPVPAPEMEPVLRHYHHLVAVTET